MMIDLISGILIVIGSTFMLISALGVLRMPDVYLRMSSSTKSATLGVATILLATAVYFLDELGIATRALATIVFLLLTAPVAAHMMARAAYFNNIPLWKGSLHDDLKGHYDPRTHALSGINQSSETPGTSGRPR